MGKNILRPHAGQLLVRITCASIIEAANEHVNSRHGLGFLSVLSSLGPVVVVVREAVREAKCGNSKYE